MLMAGLDGIKNKIDPGEPIDKDIYELEPEEKAKIKSTPGSLGEVLDALQKDHDYLLQGDVFTEDLIETWINYKTKERDGSSCPPPSSLRVPPLLRYLIPQTFLIKRRGVLRPKDSPF